MSDSTELRFLRLISGEARGVGPSLARGGLAALEPLYRSATWARNALYDLGLSATHKLDRPVISVGNLTTGGTGKTPLVAWLADALRRQLSAEVGILLRGYRSRGGQSDEAKLLADRLADSAGPSVHVLVGADRVAVAQAALQAYRNIGAFVMDDGFQHRRLHRDLDLVLIDATNPFGFNHVLPRGLLRESLKSLRRATAVLITRSDLVAEEELASIRHQVRRFSADAPILACSHEITGYQAIEGAQVKVGDLRARRIVAFAGIGNPLGFARSLRNAGCEVAGSLWFADHHHYSDSDVARIEALAREQAADAIVTTTKDAVKLGALHTSRVARWLVAQLEIRFTGDDAQRLMDLFAEKIAAHRPIQPSRELVLKKLADCFAEPTSAQQALALLDTYRSSTEAGKARVQLAILRQCGGNLARAEDLLKTAERDFRDVLVGAEYPREFAAPLNASPQSIADLQVQDRRDYEAWLKSNRP